MINEKFVILSDEDRNAKLKAVLNLKTERCLSDAELQRIASSLVLNKQYDIFVYSDEDEFRRHAQAEGSVIQAVSEDIAIAKVQEKGIVKQLHILNPRMRFSETEKKEFADEEKE